MPLPLIPIAVAGGALLATTIAGFKGKEAYDNYKKSGELVNSATESYNKAENALKEIQENVAAEFDKLGYLQASIVGNSLERYKNLIEQLDIQDSKELQEIIGRESFENIAKIKQVIVDLKSALSGIVAGGAAGAMAGFGAVGGVGMLATAGTGTAISSLSGVAATNATLAWLGGGTLASGGLGIAGGMWVLGGIVAAPLVAVTSIVVAMFSEGKLNDALAYSESFKALREAVRSEKLSWEEMINKIKEKAKILQESDTFLKIKIDEVFTTFVQKGKSVSKWEAKEQDNLKSMMQLADTIVKTINAPLMNDEDPLTQKIMAHQAKCKELIEKINAKWGK
ncbi:hypothetical protein [Helicobacter sp. UBA3407]|uniref:hypothetical protein n=1 Tax=Helicobacter TaxID=209 RepID=UPI002630CECD|nr:hypothetical protein [Helicobacter sp. UBA3407]